jgi:MFS family permease
MTDTIQEPTGLPSLASPAPDDSTGTLTGAAAVGGAPSLRPHSDPPVHDHALLPHRGRYYAVLAGILAGVSTALLTLVIVLVFAATFQAARQQMAVDRLTVKTALALAGVGLLMVTVSLLIGVVVGLIVGRIAVRRRLGFLAGALGGAIFSLLTFLVSLIPSYPGNLASPGAPVTTGSLLFAFLLLCLGSLGGGLVSLLGTWVATMNHPYYLHLHG